jgi:hypothetical protein
MISAESKSVMANALYMSARMHEDAMDGLPGTEWADVQSNLTEYPATLHGYASALLELGCDTDELRWIHDRIDTIANKADQQLQEVHA